MRRVLSTAFIAITLAGVSTLTLAQDLERYVTEQKSLVNEQKNLNAIIIKRIKRQGERYRCESILKGKYDDLNFLDGKKYSIGRDNVFAVHDVTESGDYIKWSEDGFFRDIDFRTSYELNRITKTLTRLVTMLPRKGSGVGSQSKCSRIK